MQLRVGMENFQIWIVKCKRVLLTNTAFFLILGYCDRADHEPNQLRGDM